MTRVWFSGHDVHSKIMLSCVVRVCEDVRLLPGTTCLCLVQVSTTHANDTYVILASRCTELSGVCRRHRTITAGIVSRTYFATSSRFACNFLQPIAGLLRIFLWAFMIGSVEVMCMPRFVITAYFSIISSPRIFCNNCVRLWPIILSRPSWSRRWRSNPPESVYSVFRA